MSQFALLLPYLEDDEVTEVVLQSGRPPMMKMAGEYRSITSGALNTAQIEGLIESTPLHALWPTGDTEGEVQRVVLMDRTYVARIARRGDSVQVRIGQAPKTTARAGAATAPVAPTTRPVEKAPAPPPLPKAVPPPPPSTARAPEAPDSSVRPEGPAGKAPAVALAAAPPAAAPAARVPDAPTVPRTPRADAAQTPSGALVSWMIRARERRASDVHIVSGRPVLLRVAGELTPVGEPLTHAAVEEMLLPLLDERQREALAERGYVDLGADTKGGGRLRVNVSRQKTGLKGSFRLVMEPIPSLESLGLPAEVAKVTTYHQGLVVIAGPSGHGKTTTLAAIVDIINSTRPHHVLTVEEPVEFLHAPKRAVMTQREVGLHTNTFATALKASLREDPDVIIIGELRDRETVEIAMTAAETGHLVMATMSTPSAAKTIDRLIELFPPEDQQQVRVTLAGALKFVVAQRLLPNVAGDGFVAAVEMITGNMPLWALIRDNKLFQLPSLQQRGRAFGMIRFDDSLMELFRAGKISEETLLRYADNKKEITAQLRAGQAPTAKGPAPPPPPSSTAAAAAKLGDLASRAKGLFGGKG